MNFGKIRSRWRISDLYSLADEFFRGDGQSEKRKKYEIKEVEKVLISLKMASLA